MDGNGSRSDGASRTVVVVGAGIVGSAVAYELQKLSIPTVLCERDDDRQSVRRCSCTALSAVEEASGELYEFKCQGMRGWRGWQEELGPQVGVRWDGEMRWAESEESAAFLRRIVDRAIERGYPIKYVAPAELRSRIPLSRCASILTASEAPFDGEANPAAAVGALNKAFVALGGRRVEGRATLWAGENGLVVRIAAGAIAARAVVVTTGGDRPELLAGLGIEVPAEARPAFAVLTGPVERFLRGALHVYPAAEPAFYVRQKPNGSVRIGERQVEAVPDARPDSRHARQLLERARRVLPVLRKAHVEHVANTLRVVPVDGLPIIGGLPHLPGVYVAAAPGVILAPAIAAVLSARIAGEEPPDGPGAFDPNRFFLEEGAGLSPSPGHEPFPAEVLLG